MTLTFGQFEAARLRFVSCATGGSLLQKIAAAVKRVSGGKSCSVFPARIHFPNSLTRLAKDKKRFNASRNFSRENFAASKNSNQNNTSKKAPKS